MDLRTGFRITTDKARVIALIKHRLKGTNSTVSGISSALVDLSKGEGSLTTL